MCSEKFIHTVSNFRSDSRIGSSPVVNEKFRKRCSSKEIHLKKIESSFSNPAEFTNFVRKKIRISLKKGSSHINREKFRKKIDHRYIIFLLCFSYF